MPIVNLTISSDFKKLVLDNLGLVLVDFHAAWCGPCQMISPIIDEISQSHPDISIVKIDVDQFGDIAMNYQISSIPALLIFQSGKLKNSLIGFHQKSELLGALGVK